MKALLLLTSFAALALFTGCNTVDGFGQDMEDAGDSIQDSAN